MILDNIWLTILLAYLIIVNIAGILVMAIDKRKAIKKEWRIPEKMLFFTSIIGGSLGTWAGMYMFRHKTKHWYFCLGMPLIFFIHVALAVWIAFNS